MLEDKIKYDLMRREVDRKDKIESAYHEAGHAAAAIILGRFNVKVLIFPSGAKDFITDKMWVGKTGWFRVGRQARNEIIAVAGAISARMNQEGADWEWESLLDEFFDFDDFGELGLSPTDVKLMGEHDFEDVVEESYMLLKENWKMVEKIAEALINNEDYENPVDLDFIYSMFEVGPPELFRELEEERDCPKKENKAL